jgi:hypothetical protein
MDVCPLLLHVRASKLGSTSISRRYTALPNVSERIDDIHDCHSEFYETSNMTTPKHYIP